MREDRGAGIDPIMAIGLMAIVCWIVVALAGALIRWLI